MPSIYKNLHLHLQLYLKLNIYYLFVLIYILKHLTKQKETKAKTVLESAQFIFCKVCDYIIANIRREVFSESYKKFLQAIIIHAKSDKIMNLC